MIEQMKTVFDNLRDDFWPDYKCPVCGKVMVDDACCYVVRCNHCRFHVSRVMVITHGEDLYKFVEDKIEWKRDVGRSRQGCED